MGFVNRKDQKEINLQSFNLRESYVDAFGDGLKISSNLKTLNLRRNQLTTNRVLRILEKVPFNLLEIDLSYNPLISIEAIRTISEDIIENSKFKLQQL
jgi:hypothetical protein